MVFENLDKNMEIFHFCTGETIFFYDSLHRTGETTHNIYNVYIFCTILIVPFTLFIGILFGLF